MKPEWQHGTAVVGGNPIHYVEQGEGPPVVLLHGFPEFWYSWRGQIPPLAEAGFRVIAPDLRGFNLSHRPPGLRPYRAVEVADEMVGLIDVLAGGRAHLVAHDWGGIVAWLMVMRNPAAIDRLAILNTPHPSALRAIRRRPAQALRFSYQLFFQLPLIPEAMLSAFHHAGMKRAMKSMLRNRKAFTPEVAAEYERSWGQPGAITAMMNYYRALFRLPREFPRGEAKIVRRPTLMIWGEHDPVFRKEPIEGTAAFVDDFTLERLPHAGHFVHQDDPVAVNALLIDFLRSPQSGGAGR